MRTSNAGIALIEQFEGCDLVARLDTLADPPVWTIGHGETGPYVHEGLRYTQEQAKQGLLRRLAAEFEPGVLAALQGAPVSQSQFDAMVSLSWNIGVGGFSKSSVARLHRAGDYQGAADAFRLWNKAGGQVYDGLVRRREEERALYLSSEKPAKNIPEIIPAPHPANDNCPDRDLVADLVRALQRVVGAEPDGRIGPKTYDAVQQAQRRVA